MFCRILLPVVCFGLSLAGASFPVATAADGADATPGNGVCATAAGVCTLRAAIQEANALAGADTVTVPAGTYTLTLGSIEVGDGTTVSGAGAGATTVEMAVPANGRVFRTRGAVEIGGMTIRNGDATKTQLVLETVCGSDGGAVQVDGGALALRDAVLTQNIGTYASAVCVIGSITMERVRVTGNVSVLADSGVVKIGTQISDSGGTLDQVEFARNVDAVGRNGNGLMVRGAGTVTVGRSLFDAQGLLLVGAPVVGLTNVTMVAGDILAAGQLTLTNATVRGGTLSVAGATVRAQNSVLLGACGGTVTSAGNNVVNALCVTTGGADATTTAGDATFGPLAQNGGFTRTVALLPGSPAIDAGNAAACPATDQRLTPRPAGAGCDIGAFERVSSTAFTVNAAVDEGDVAPGDGICSSANGNCSLRAAVEEANAAAGANTVNVPAGVYRLPQGTLSLRTELTLVGAGAENTIIEMPPDGAATGRVLRAEGTVAVSGVTVRNGDARRTASVDELRCGTDGGGVMASAGVFTLSDAVVTGNLGTHAGGICAYAATVTLRRVRVTGNISVLADSAAVKLGTEAFDVGGTLDEVEISGNSDSLGQVTNGLLLRGAGQVRVTRSLLDGARLTMVGAPVAELTNVTVVNGEVSAAGQLTMGNVTVRGGTLRTGTAVVRAQNSVLLGTCVGSVQSLGNNVTGEGCQTGNGGDRATTSGDLTFGPLGLNGGYTRTVPLLPGNPAIDFGNGAACASEDQRGVARPLDGNNDGSAICDSGAYETNGAERLYAIPTATTPGSPGTATNVTVRGTALPGTAVELFGTADCRGTAVVALTGTDGSWTANYVVGANSTTTFGARVQQAGQPCSAGVTYVHDGQAPAAPAGLATTPGSPGTATAITVRGSAENGAAVAVFLNGTCAGAPAGSGSSNGSFAVPVTVGANRSTSITARATDAAGNVSACSGGIAYVHDSIAPATPSGLAVSPASPSNATSITVTGTAEAGATVSVYRSTACTGTAAGTGVSGGTFAVAVTVANGATTMLTARAVDAAGNASGCSAVVTYVSVASVGVAIGSVKQLEGSGTTTTFQFPVTLAAASVLPVTVSYATQDGTATAAGGDYKAQSGTLTIPAGQTKAFISVPVNGDKTAEADETFTVTLTGATGAVINGARATGTISNDDNVGIGEVGVPDLTVTAGVPFLYPYRWIVPAPGTWHELTTMSMRVRKGATVVFELVWDQGANTFALVNPVSGRRGAAFAPGSPHRLGNGHMELAMPVTTARGGGPTSPLVTLTLGLEFRPAEAGTYVVEGAATDDQGQDQPWTEMGVIRVERR